MRRSLANGQQAERGDGGAFAEDTVKIGFILPMTGQQQQSTGKQESAAVKLYMPARREDHWPHHAK
jgi:branched-chain amino acid transport system substrate-binding protein